MQPVGSPFSGLSGPAAPFDSLPPPLPPPGSACPPNGISGGGLALGIGLIVGTLLSYLPQFYSIWRRKTVEGLNFGSVALGVGSTSCIFVNFLFIKWSVKQACCQMSSAGKCIAFTMDGQQIFSAVLCSIILYAMWMWYYQFDQSPEAALGDVDERRKFRNFVRFGLGVAISFLVMSIVLAGLLNAVWKTVRVAHWIGFLMGIAGTCCVVLQWAPQIWTTWKLQAVGSLSVLMLSIQLPGTLAVIYFQGFVNSAHWSTLLPYVVTSIEFTLLIALCLFFMARDWWRQRNADLIAAAHPDYAFAHLDQNIPTRRTIITNPDEAEAESMMNLEALDDDDDDEYDHTISEDPTLDFSSNMGEIQQLLRGLSKPQKKNVAEEEETYNDLDVVDLDD